MAIVVDLRSYTDLNPFIAYGLFFIALSIIAIIFAYAIAFLLRECTDQKPRKKIYRIKNASKIGKHHQQVVFIRHAQAKHNADFRALNERDPPLTDLGVEQADDRRVMIDTQFPEYLNEVDMIVCSPLRRTINTMTQLFRNGRPPTKQVIIEPLAAERGSRLCNVGTNRAAVLAEFPEIQRWRIKDWQEEWWKYPEDDGTFRVRMQRFKTWIQSRPERNILIITHDQVIRALTSKKASNADMVIVNWKRPQRN